MVVAAGGAAIGAKVILIEKNKLGGDCLYTGCVPSKALLHTAKVAYSINQSSNFGLKAKLQSPGLADVMAYVKKVIASIEPNDSPDRFRSLGVEVVFGQGKFSGPTRFEINNRSISARKYVVATGTRPFIPDIEGLGNVSYLTNENIFSVSENIGRLIVVGAGVIGIELAQAIRRLGSRVVVVSSGQNILAQEDKDLAEVIYTQLVKEGVDFHLGSSVRSVAQMDGEYQVDIRNSKGKSEVIKGTHLLIATGRRPNIEDLGLKAAGIQTTARGIIANRRLRSTNKKVFACGDVIGSYQFTHMAEHHAGIVLRNALFHIPAKTETRVIPWCIFTEPELARVGLSETEAINKNVTHEITQFPFSDIDRARTDNITEGFIKVVTGKKGKILGASIVGPQAGELIHEYVLAIKKGMNLGELSSLIHIYPTLAQINRRVADSYLKKRLTAKTRRWLKRLFSLRGNDQTEN